MCKVVLYTVWDRIAPDIVDVLSYVDTDAIEVRIEDKYLDRVHFFSTLFTKLAVSVSSNSARLCGCEEVFVSKYLKNIPHELEDKDYTLVGDDHVTEMYRMLIKSELVFSGNTPYASSDLKLEDFVINRTTLTNMLPKSVINNLNLDSSMCLFLRQMFNPARVKSLNLPAISEYGQNNCIITPVDKRYKDFYVVGVNTKEFYDVRENIHKDYYIYRTLEFNRENISNLTKALDAYYFAKDIYY